MLLDMHEEEVDVEDERCTVKKQQKKKKKKIGDNKLYLYRVFIVYLSFFFLDGAAEDRVERGGDIP